jgi:hypothetical protein
MGRRREEKRRGNGLEMVQPSTINITIEVDAYNTVFM